MSREKGKQDERIPPKVDLARAYDRHGKDHPTGRERKPPVPVKTGKPHRPEDVPGYQGDKPKE